VKGRLSRGFQSNFFGVLFALLLSPNTIVIRTWNLPKATSSHDRFTTSADKRKGANSSFVHFEQVMTVLGSEASG
jgi:hypothetical protein